MKKFKSFGRSKVDQTVVGLASSAVKVWTTLALLTLSLSPLAAAESVIVASQQWTAGNGHQYVVVGLNGATWEEAIADLNTLFPSLHLATITSQEEQDFLNGLLSSQGLFGQYWVGGFQDAPKPEVDPAVGWQWVTGEPWGYVNWSAPEPNDAGGIEDHLTTSVSGWNDEGTAVASVSGYIAESSPGAQPELTVMHESGSPLWPAGTSRVGDDGTYVSVTDDPTGPFTGRPVHFRGKGFGGTEQVFRYRLEFDREVQLISVVISGAAWLGFPSDVIKLLDENGNELASVNVPIPPQGSNSFQTVVLDASGIIGSTFFLEEFNDDGNWRYRSNISVNVVPSPTTPVSIDVKPNQYPNCFRRGPFNPIPVAILGSEEFDVTMINTDSLSLNALDAGVQAGVKSCQVRDVNKDKIPDLVCRFKDSRTKRGEAILSGELNDGSQFSGADSICLLYRGRPPSGG